MAGDSVCLGRPANGEPVQLTMNRLHPNARRDRNANHQAHEDTTEFIP